MKSFARSLASLPLSRWRPGFALLFGVAYGLWLLLRPVNHVLFAALDDWGVTAVLGIMSLVCLFALGKQWRRHLALGTSFNWASVLLWLGLVSYTIGQGIWTYYEQILHQSTPFPSLADAGFLAVYPFVLGGIFLLPTQPLSLSSRMRIALDGLMLMTAIVTLSWYFILGPTIEQDGHSAGKSGGSSVSLLRFAYGFLSSFALFAYEKCYAAPCDAAPLILTDPFDYC